MNTLERSSFSRGLVLSPLNWECDLFSIMVLVWIALLELKH